MECGQISMECTDGLSIAVIVVSRTKLFLGWISMSDLDRGIMKFKGADSPIAIVISSTLVLGGIVILVVWAMQNAYAV
jgi:hypothetical protein